MSEPFSHRESDEREVFRLFIFKRLSKVRSKTFYLEQAGDATVSMDSLNGLSE